MGAVEDGRYGPGPLKGMRVLVVEDAAPTAYAIETILIANGARLAGTCASCAHALRRLDETEIDFALIDLLLDGDFADKLMHELVKRSISFAVLTGLLGFPSNAAEHAVAILHKPLDADALVAVLARYAE